jgi:hypothetical protein
MAFSTELFDTESDHYRREHVLQINKTFISKRTQQVVENNSCGRAGTHAVTSVLAQGYQVFGYL